MKIIESFVEEILKEDFSTDFQYVYDKSMLLQYLDKKMKAVHGNSKARRSLASIYAIYSILHFYQEEFLMNQINIGDLTAMIIYVYSSIIVVCMEEVNFKIML